MLLCNLLNLKTLTEMGSLMFVPKDLQVNKGDIFIN